MRLKIFFEMFKIVCRFKKLNKISAKVFLVFKVNALELVPRNFW